MMSRMIKTIATALALAGVVNATSKELWAQQSIYQVMTDRFALSNGSTDAPCNVLEYCGGTWTGIIEKLDYIQGMGFTAIQISPVDENIPDNTPYGEAYHGYWPINKYALNSHFGTAGDLSHLSQALHDRGMYLMVDVVINDMAQAIHGSMPNQTINYSALQPFNDKKYYHPYCNITDYNNFTDAQDCWLGVTNVALPDLDTESDAVIQMTGQWITELVANYSIDGLRIDAAKHVDDAFLPPFLKAAGVFTFGEVYTGVTEDMCRYQQKNLLAGLPNYLEYFPLIRAFTAGDMVGLAEQVNDTRQACNDTTVLGTFAENHDLPRFATLVDDMTLAKNALAYVILADGIPTVYQGQEQHFKGAFAPDNRAQLWSSNYNMDAPLYNLTAKLNGLRNHVIQTDSRYVTQNSQMLYLDNSTMCTRKGPEGVQIVACFSNQGSNGGSYNLSVPLGFKEGDEVMEIMNCTRSFAYKGGNVTAEMAAGQPRVFFPISNMNGSGLCGFSKDKTAGMGNGTSTSSSANSSSTHKPNAASDVASVKIGTILMSVLFAVGFWML